MTGLNAHPPKNRPRRRRWFQYSLRTLLVLMLAGGVWLGWKVNLAREQRKIVEAVHAAGGYVRYEFEGERAETREPDHRPWPDWLENVFGRDFLYDVVFVGFSDDIPPALRPPDYEAKVAAALRQAGRLPHLRGLRIDNVRTPAYLEGLSSVKQIRRLRLSVMSDYEGDLDRDLSALRNLTRLVDLKIFAYRLTDEGLVHLERLVRLARLELDYTQTTFDGLSRLKKALPHCEVYD